MLYTALIIVIILAILSLIALGVYLVYLEHTHQSLIRILESKFESDTMSHAEKKSRARVAQIIKSNLPPIKKCMALDNEMALIENQVTVSRLWKNILRSLFDDILRKHDLTLRTNRNGGTYIFSTKGEGFSTCLQMY